MLKNELEEKVQAVRSFNRFYTKQIGLLNQGLLKTPFPLTQARILFELANHKQCTARDLINELEIDQGYLSRILSAFEKGGLIRKERSTTDSRQRLLTLTPKGRAAFSDLNERSNKETEALLLGILEEDRTRFLNAMQTIESVLSMKKEPANRFLVRSHRSGDIGWVLERHGALYLKEYGWGEDFEYIVADILSRFLKQYDPKREQVWIAEQDGERIGSIMIVDAGEQTAQLRLLLVDPKARGKGIGSLLIDECINFSRRAGYKKIRLSTRNILFEARHLYAKAGFKIVDEIKRSHSGQDLVEEIWELSLTIQ